MMKKVIAAKKSDEDEEYDISKEDGEHVESVDLSSEDDDEEFLTRLLNKSSPKKKRKIAKQQNKINIKKASGEKSSDS